MLSPKGDDEPQRSGVESASLAQASIVITYPPCGGEKPYSDLWAKARQTEKRVGVNRDFVELALCEWFTSS